MSLNMTMRPSRVAPWLKLCQDKQLSRPASDAVLTAAPAGLAPGEKSGCLVSVIQISDTFSTNPVETWITVSDTPLQSLLVPFQG